MSEYRDRPPRWCVLVERTITQSAIIEVRATGPEEAKRLALEKAAKPDPACIVPWEVDSRALHAEWAISSTEFAQHHQARWRGE